MILKRIRNIKHIGDYRRIQEVLRKCGYIEATLIECEQLWDEVSENRSAGYINLPDDDNTLWDYLEPCLMVIDTYGKLLRGYDD